MLDLAEPRLDTDEDGFAGSADSSEEHPRDPNRTHAVNRPHEHDVNAASFTRMIVGLCLVLCVGCGGADEATAAPQVPPGDPDATGADTPGLGDVPPLPTGTCRSAEDCNHLGGPGSCVTASCVDGYCVADPVSDMRPCDDADPCTVATRCLDGSCADGQPISCADGNPCTWDSCDQTTGCEHTPSEDGSTCDDTDPCTALDACQAAQCVGSPVETCACESEADCAGHEDSNLCNGTLRCVAGHCTLDSKTVVICPPGGTCHLSACSPATGLCSELPEPNGTGCDDGNPCTLEDACDLGACVGTTQICACTTGEDCKSMQQEGYDICQGPLVCNDGTCMPEVAQEIVCEDQTQDPCLTTACDPGTGICATVARPDGTVCDVDAPCVSEGSCQQGVCTAPPADCDDGDPCTADLCLSSGCEHTLFDGPCNDGDPCTQGEVCVDAVCGDGDAVICDDLNPCTIDLCVPTLGGCQAEAVAEDTPCASTAPCLTAGSCEAGVCANQEAVACPEGGPCTEAVCLPDEGCTFKAAVDGDPCDDGDPCHQPGVCKGGGCAALPVPCSDGNPCTIDACDSEVGDCVHQAADEGVTCAPSDPCLVDGSCATGVCEGGEPVSCESGPCDVQECNSETGTCAVVGVALPGTECGSAGPCTTVGACQDGACVGSGPVTCDDGDACTIDSCENEVGSCHHMEVVCPQTGGDACLEATCDVADGCIAQTSAVCASGTVLLSTTLPCEGGLDWDFKTTGGAPVFAVGVGPDTATPYDDDCALYVPVSEPVVPGDEAWTTTARAPDFELPPTDAAQLGVGFVEWWPVVAAEPSFVRKVVVVGYVEGEDPVSVTSILPTGNAEVGSWESHVAWVDVDPTWMSLSVAFTLEAIDVSPALDSGWLVDKVAVVLAE